MEAFHLQRFGTASTPTTTAVHDGLLLSAESSPEAAAETRATYCWINPAVFAAFTICCSPLRDYRFYLIFTSPPTPRSRTDVCALAVNATSTPHDEHGYTQLLIKAAPTMPNKIVNSITRWRCKLMPKSRESTSLYFSEDFLISQAHTI